MKTLITIATISFIISFVLMWVIFPTQKSELEIIVDESKEKLEQSDYAKYITGYKHE